MSDREERRKMAWQIALSLVERRDDIPMDRVARVSWKVVDSFLENEGGDELPDHDRMRLVAVMRTNLLINDEAKKLKVENEKLTKQLENATSGAHEWRQLYRDACYEKENRTKERNELDAGFKQVTKECNKLKAELESLEHVRDVMRDSLDERINEREEARKERDHLKAENEKLAHELEKLTAERAEELNNVECWKNNYELVAGKRDALEAENEKITKDRDELLREKAHCDGKLGAMEREFDQIKGELECRRAAMKQPQIDDDDDHRSDYQKHEQPHETIGDTIAAVKARIAAVKARESE